MLKDLASYFEPTHEFYLNSISYERKSDEFSQEPRELTCVENIGVTLNEDVITVILKRTLKFDPSGIFELVVSFGANLRFVKEKKDEVEWEKINIAEEFRDNGDFVLANLAARTSLLIGEITASYGQNPLMTPPTQFNKLNQNS